MKKGLMIAVATSILVLGACRQEDISLSNNQTQGVIDEPRIANSSIGDPGNGMGAAQGQPDRQFVQDAAASDLFEIESSRLAAQRATLPAAKTYAEMMIEQHGKALDDLKAAAQAAGVAVPTALPPDKAAKIEALRGLNGAAFDRQYLTEQRLSHQQGLATVNGYIAAATGGPLQAHASKLTGVVQNHLDALERIK